MFHERYVAGMASIDVIQMFETKERSTTVANCFKSG